MSKVILVTGASRGIGRAIVDILSKTEDVVVLGVSRSEAPLKELKRQYGQKFDYTVGDLTDKKVIEEVVATVRERYGRLDALVANAGALEPVSKIEHAKVEEWRRLFEINFFSVVALVQGLLPLLRASSGTAVFVSSGASVSPYYAWGSYGASKAALNHFVHTLALEEKSITTISVAPGVVDTKMQEDIREVFSSCMDPEAAKRFKDLKLNNELLPAEVPGAVIANLALRGVPETLSGLYLRYSDQQLSNFAS